MSNLDREKKLEILKKRDTIKSLQITGNGEAFIEILEATVNELKDSLGAGVDVNNLDDLVEQLGKIESFEKEVSELKDSISAIKFPGEVDVKGIESLTLAVEKLSKLPKPVVQKIDFSVLDSVVDGILTLVDKVEQLQVPKQGQLPEDYVPMRRVQKVGNKLYFDDSLYSGGGGGGGGLSPADSASLSTVASSVVTRDKVGDQNTTITSSTAATTIVTAQAATYLDLVGLILTNTSATGSEVQLLDDDGSTVRAVFWCPATDVRGVVFSKPFNQSAVNKTWKLKTVTSIASLKVTAQYVENT